MISFVHIDRDLAQPDLDVEVAWDVDPDKQQVVRARTIMLPFKPDNRGIDVTW